MAGSAPLRLPSGLHSFDVLLKAIDPALCAGWQETIMKSGMANFAPIGSVGWALEAIVPIAFGWIVVYLIVGSWRWVRAGFAV
jgi:hypothetical protein